MGEGFSFVGEHEVHQGYVWRVVRADFRSPSGEMFQRDIVRSPGAVAVVPLVFDPQGHPSVVLVEQYRSPYEQSLIEIPAGMRDVPGEAPENTGRRELIEEVGLAAEVLELLHEMKPSPGLTDSITHIYLASGCTPVERSLHGPEEEHSRVLHLPLDDALAMVDSGEITDAKTTVGLLLLDRRLRTER